MFKSLSILSCVLLINILPGTLTMTAEQKQMVHQHFEEVGIECLKTNKITTDDIRNLRDRKIPDGENVPCFLACIFKHVGILDGNGMLQKESAMELAKKVFNDDEEVKVIEDYLHSCAHVNSGDVGDGDKGCERSMLAYKCMIENASQVTKDIFKNENTLKYLKYMIDVCIFNKYDN